MIKKQEETLPSPELYTDMGGKVSLQLPIGSKGEKELPNVIRNVIGHIEFARPLDKK